MRIGLNLLHARPDIGGAWNYIANLLAALGEYDHTNKFVAFVTEDSRRLVPDGPNFEAVPVRLRAESQPLRVLFENTFFPILARKYQLDCMHWFANYHAIFNTVPAVVTVYDLLAFNKAKTSASLKRAYLRWMIKLTVRRSPVLLPMSLATADELKRSLGADPERLFTVPAIVEPFFHPATPEAAALFRRKHRLPEKFWLYVAHFNLHKNHSRLLEAYRSLKQDSARPWPLVLRGDNKWEETGVASKIRALNLSNDVFRLPSLDRNELPALYSSASAMVFPSLYEGSGIPVIEAMACGCPVAASDIPPVRENAKDAALYFNPMDVSAMAKAMLYLQTNEKQREIQRNKGLLTAGKFRAESIVPILQKAYRMAVTNAFQNENNERI